jgi:hypothetical protein
MAGGAAPDPPSGIPSTLFVPVFVSATLPVAAVTTDGGWNTTLKLVLCPAGSTMGKVNPLIVNPVPVTLTLVRLRLAVPVLVTVSGSTWIVPTATVPNERLGDDAVS